MPTEGCTGHTDRKDAQHPKELLPMASLSPGSALNRGLWEPCHRLPSQRWSRAVQGRLMNSLAVHTQSMKINKAFSKAHRKKKVDELKGGWFFKETSISWPCTLWDFVESRGGRTRLGKFRLWFSSGFFMITGLPQSCVSLPLFYKLKNIKENTTGCIIYSATSL